METGKVLRWRLSERDKMVLGKWSYRWERRREKEGLAAAILGDY